MSRRILKKSLFIVLILLAYTVAAGGPAFAQYDHEAAQALRRMFLLIRKGNPEEAYYSFSSRPKKDSEDYATVKKFQNRVIKQLAKDKGARFQILHGYKSVNGPRTVNHFYFWAEKDGRKKVGYTMFEKIKDGKLYFRNVWKKYDNLQQACNENVTMIKKGLEKYKKVYKKYPKSLDKMSSYYLRYIPQCPAGQRDTYSSGYRVFKKGKAYELKCTQRKH